MVNYKDDEYHQKRHPEFLNSNLISKAWSEFAHLEYFNGLNNDDIILEFGGGLGNNLFHLAKTHKVFMVEPSDLGRKNAEKFGVKTVSSIPELKKLNSDKFDIVLCRHVLEHVDNPLQTLIDLKALLKPNGELILVLPFEKKTRPVRNEIDFHLFCWTPRTAVNLLKSAKFEVVKWNYNLFTGKRLFLPIYKLFGVKYYRFCMKLTGLVFNSKELLLRAK